MKPYVTIEWNDTESDAIGWLCIYNLVDGYAGGGIRMSKDVDRETVVNLAEVMAYKRNAAKNSRKGGMKGGIKYDPKAPDAREVLKRYIIAMRPYVQYSLNIGSDMGTSDLVIKEIEEEIGMGEPLTPEMRVDPVVEQGVKNVYKGLYEEVYPGMKVETAVTGYGAAYCADEAWKQLGGKPGATVIVQGFGNAGIGCVDMMDQLGYKVVGISDVNCFVYCEDGLDVKSMMKSRLPMGEIDRSKLDPSYKVLPNTEWINYPCDIFMPAAIRDVLTGENAAQFKGKLISEAANLPLTPEADEYLHAHGVHTIPDFVANLGEIRFFYVMTFCEVEPTAEAIVADLDKLCRENAHNLVKASLETGRFERDIAKELFVPTVQDIPHMPSGM